MKNKICIIGLGYVGLPLATKLSKYYEVYGFDKKYERVNQLKKREDINREFNKKDLKNLNIKNLFYNKNYLKKINCNIFIITVPTPVTKKNNPDIKLLTEATTIVSKIIKPGDIVVYESTVYPGLTEDICKKILEKNSQLECVYGNKNYKNGFSLCYSPERINPGDKLHQIENITKIISGSNAGCVKIIKKIYSKLTNNKIFVVKNIKTAEAAKIIENIQRDLNIALMNELTIIFNEMDINMCDVLEAASTKWNFHKYYPGLVGGHCIGVDPYYLTYKAKKLGIKPKVILSGRTINDSMSLYFALKIKKILKKNTTNNKKILIMGFAFKENVSDIRNTKIYDLYKNLKKNFKRIDIYDPVVNQKEVLENYNIKLLKKPNYKKYDSIVFALSHKVFQEININKIKKENKKVFLIQIKKVFKNNLIDFTF